MGGYQKNRRMLIKRGDVFYANLSPVIGSEQGGSRPVLILQNNIGNKYSPTIIVAAITAQISKGKLPTHIELKADKCKLERDSVVLLEQLRTIDKKRLRNKITTLDSTIMKSVDEAVKISVGLVKI